MERDVTPPPILDEWPTSLDEEQTDEGAEVFFSLERRIENLDKELRNLLTAAYQLGGSVSIYSSALRLRERLSKISFLFRENAAILYPRKIQRKPCVFLHRLGRMNRWRRGPYREQRALAAKAILEEGNLELDMFPTQFDSFAGDILSLLDCLNEFSKFTNETLNQSIESFEADLRYWSSCLYECKHQFHSPGVQRYVHDLAPEIGDHIDNITTTLSTFIEIGIPMMTSQQQHDVSNALNLSTLATFFSAVTATMLQYSYTNTGHVLADSVNAFWFASLVLSIAASVNSLLKLTWKQAVYRSPRYRAPQWVLFWIKQSSLICLVMSVACFSVGLVLFTYSSRQGPVTSTITTVLTAVTSFGLAVSSVWFASERWVFFRHKGRKLLAEVISEAANCVTNNRAARAIRTTLHRWSMHIDGTRAYLSRSQQTIDQLPIMQLPQSAPPRPPPPYTREHAPSIPKPETAISAHPILTESATSRAEERLNETAETRRSGARRSWSATRSMTPHRNSSPIASRFSAALMPRGRSSGLGHGTSLRGERMMKAMKKLRTLDVVQVLAAHEAVVRHVKFSPDGKYLATLSWDRTSVIFRVGKSLTTHCTLVHGTRGFIGQIAWCPGSRTLLTRSTRGVKVWSEDGVCKETIDRHNTVQSIVWLPTGDAFLSVEGSEVVKLDLHGNVLDIYHFGQVKLTNVAVSPDGTRLVGIGPSIAPPSGPQPSRQIRVEKRIVVYNLQTRRRESQTPFADDVRDIAVARKTPAVLISREKGAPQLWILEIVPTRDQPEYAQTSRMNWKHTFTLKHSTADIVGPCRFGGKDDQFVLCASKAGDVHIWDRETATLLHHIQAENASDVGNLTSIAWNRATDDPMMLAIGSREGTIRIYSTPSAEGLSDDGSNAERHAESERGTNSSAHSDG